MRTREVKVGMWVWTRGTESGDWYLCHVLKPTDKGEWVLRSPEFARNVTRHARELKRLKERRGIEP